MKKLSIIAVVGLMVSTSVLAHRQCRTRYDRWGNRVTRCHSHTHHHHSDTADAVVAGAVIGATAGVLAATCAPEVMEGNATATDKALANLANSEAFAGAEKFKAMVAETAAVADTKTKIASYFALVDVTDATEMAYFLGARKDEFGKYGQILAEKADLSSEQAETVVNELVSTLKGNLR